MTSLPTMRRSATHCIQRGWLNLRANWQLVPLSLLGSLLVLALAIASVVPPILVLGGWELVAEAREVFGSASGGDPTRAEAWMAAVLDRAVSSGAPLLLSLVASTVIGLALAAVWAFFQGGTAGVLVAGDRQAPPAAASQTGGWRWFRTYSFRDFSGWGGHLLWRFFSFFHLALLVPLVLVALWALVVLLLSLGAQEAVVTTAGCLGLVLSVLVLVGAFLVFAIWAVLAQPALALEGATVGGAARFAFALLFRRPWAVLAIVVLIFGPAVLLGVTLAISQILIETLSGSTTLVSSVFWLVQQLVSALLGALFVAMATALVVGESRTRDETP